VVDRELDAAALDCRDAVDEVVAGQLADEDRAASRRVERGLGGGEPGVDLALHPQRHAELGQQRAGPGAGADHRPARVDAAGVGVDAHSVSPRLDAEHGDAGAHARASALRQPQRGPDARLRSQRAAALLVEHDVAVAEPELREAARRGGAGEHVVLQPVLLRAAQ
jgi:hypothetical protein